MPWGGSGTGIPATVPFIGQIGKLAFILPSGDTSGGTDLANVNAAYLAGSAVILTPGIFYANGTLNLNSFSGAQLIGCGSGVTTWRQVTANTTIIKTAGQGQRVMGLKLEYASQQPSANTSAVGLMFGDPSAGSCFMCEYDDLFFFNCAQAMQVNPALSVTNIAGLFSCWFGTIQVLGQSIGTTLEGNAGGGSANCTGCVFDNIYFHNNASGSDVGTTFYPILFKSWDELVINQLNVEHSQVFLSDPVGFSAVGNAVVNSLHLEHLEISGTPGWGLVYNNNSTVMVNGLTVRFSTFTGTSYNSVLRFDPGTNGGNTYLRGLKLPAENIMSTPAFPLIDFGSATGSPLASISGVLTDPGVTANFVNAVTGCVAQIEQSYQALTVAVPVSGSPTAAQVQSATFYWTAGVGGLSVSQDGVSVGTVAAGAVLSMFVPGGTTVTPTYANAPTLQVRTTGDG